MEALAAGIASFAGSGGDAIIFLEDREQLQVSLTEPDGELEVVASRGRGVSVGWNNRSAHLADPEPDDVARLIQAVRRDPPVLGPPRGKEAGESGPFRLDVGAASTQIRALGHRLVAADGRAGTILRAGWVESTQRVLVARPGRPCQADSRRACRVRVDLRSVERGREVAAADEWVLGDASTLEAADVGPVVRRFHDRRGLVRPVAGDVPVVLAAGTSGILFHEVVGHALEADTVARGGSALARADGMAIPRGLLIVDDPRRGRASWRWDDEGEEARPTPLVQAGRVAGLMTDLRTARPAGRSPSGHARRSSHTEPTLPRMGCTFLAPGPLTALEVEGSVRHGVYVRRMESATTDPARGEATFRVTDADRIQEGRIEAPLGPFLLRVRLPDALTTIDLVADDLEFDRCIGACIRDGQPLATSVGGPTCRLGVATILC